MVSSGASSTEPACSKPTVTNPDYIRVMRPMADDLVHISMEAACERNWSELPNELLEGILSHLYGEDVRSFHLVCRSWHAVEEYLFQKEHNPLVFPVPESQWLLHKPQSELTYEFIHPVYPNVRYAKKLLEGAEKLSYSGAIVRHSKDGWLLMSRENGSMFFFCPFPETVVELPALIWEYELDGIAFSCDPVSSTDPCVIFIISYLLCTHVEIAILGPGKKWKSVGSENNIPFKPCYCSSPVFYKEMFYCLSIDGNLGVYNHKANTWTVLEKPVSPCPRKWAYESHLVEHEGGLMSMFMGESGSWVSVFKLNESDMVWENVYSLGDYALFVSIPTSFARNSVLDMMKNKIFFPLLHNNYPVFYCLETKTFRTYGTDLCENNFYRTEIAEQLESCWIEPTEYERKMDYVFDEETEGDETSEDDEYETNDESGSEEEEEEDETNNGEKYETSDESSSEEEDEDETNNGEKYTTRDKSHEESGGGDDDDDEEEEE